MRNRVILVCLLGILAMFFVCDQPTLAKESPAQTEEGSTTEIACPRCKEMTMATKKGGGVHLEKEMICPDCKGAGTTLEPHVCKKCGEEVYLCSLCKKVVAHVTEKPVAKVICPSCKEQVTAVKKGGSVVFEKAMVCPSCKEKIEELGVFECKKCGKDILACPVCKQYSGTVVREEPAVEVKCPTCKEMTQATKKAGGVSLENKMICPNCKKAIRDADVHTCSKCGADIFLCPLCKKTM
ncbi:MAG TPA: hypothetical protein ACFYEM_07295 [Candidatus Hypogeohydataceae bacterium YC40]